MKYRFPEKPRTWFGPDDWTGGDPQIEDAEQNLRILIWNTGYSMLTPWERFRVGMGWRVDIDFKLNYHGPVEYWGIVPADNA